MRAGADLNLTDSYLSPLELAVETGDEELVKMLLAAGAKADSIRAVQSAFEDHRDSQPHIARPESEAIVVALLRAGAPIERRESYFDVVVEAVRKGLARCHSGPHRPRRRYQSTRIPPRTIDDATRNRY